MRTLITLILAFLVCINKAGAQTDPEFPKGFVMYAKLHNGMTTDFTAAPDLYVGGIQLAPMYTAVENLLRVGIVGDIFYTAKKLQAGAGPVVAFKLATINAGTFGSVGNINLGFDHLWGSEQQRLLGTSINADLFNLVIVGLHAHRDYNLSNWWFQSSVGIRLSKKKTISEPFND